MSLESCINFLRQIDVSDDFKRQMKAITDTEEVIALGRKHGYIFDGRELMAASSSLNGANGSHTKSGRTGQAPAIRSAFYHYEFDMEHIPGFEKITRELNNLKIKPSSVNMRHYEQSFCEDDFQFTSMSPAEPEFQHRYQEIMQSQWKDASDGYAFSRRDFHLVNLDQHVEHQQYEQYFQAKTRMIAYLEDFFGDDVQFSGSMWYPPRAYRLWHTNETQPGWRMYLIDFDGPAEDAAGASFFRYMNPLNKEIVTLKERPKLARFFKIEQEKDKLFWHCIVNATTCNRWSFGFAVPEHWLDKLTYKS